MERIECGKLRDFRGGIVAGDNYHTLKGKGFRVRQTCAQISVPLLTGCVSLGKCLNFLTSLSLAIQDVFIHHPRVSGTVLDTAGCCEYRNESNEAPAGRVLPTGKIGVRLNGHLELAEC